MGWEIHITRAEDWVDNEACPITQNEWLEFVDNDPEMMIDPRDNGPYVALWLSHSIGNDHPWFDWSSGNIDTSRPDQKTLGKALQIARHFGATVQGDDGETYGRAEDLSQPPCNLRRHRRQWWKFW